MDRTYYSDERETQKLRGKKNKRPGKARKLRGVMYDDLEADEEKDGRGHEEEVWGEPDSYEDQFVDWN